MRKKGDTVRSVSLVFLAHGLDSNTITAAFVIRHCGICINAERLCGINTVILKHGDEIMFDSKKVRFSHMRRVAQVLHCAAPMTAMRKAKRPPERSVSFAVKVSLPPVSPFAVSHAM